MINWSKMFLILSLLCFAVPAFAQGGESGAATNWVPIAAGFSMAFASGICALGPRPEVRPGKGRAHRPAARGQRSTAGLIPSLAPSPATQDSDP